MHLTSSFATEESKNEYARRKKKAWAKQTKQRIKETQLNVSLFDFRLVLLYVAL